LKIRSVGPRKTSREEKRKLTMIAATINPKMDMTKGGSPITTWVIAKEATILLLSHKRK
jgi:hypothetical protein